MKYVVECLFQWALKVEICLPDQIRSVNHGVQIWAACFRKSKLFKVHTTSNYTVKTEK